ncbi:hypothetical protein [Actinoplanes awajinensis]|uniref:Uncharacterized protein n=1 Tax=Actinoplanes awajinensis subsp. mycoplanecinus TaxID=135947 RepID=A0A101JGQ3_9ACTN|nr:hypothetical protein [Actinoplanes awajinensis]KUL26533.1 hypothetical protein ADL15_38285 [Actinoplanes awajinensis subsp. mycoplanecinus]
MARRFRYRVAALVASGLLLGLPLLSTGTASADQFEPGDRRVTFGGGVLGLSCSSQPSVEKLTVPADSTLHVVNRTGHDARLELAGASKGVIPDDGAAEVLFRRGTTPVLLTPDCTGADDPVPMLVTAVPSAAASLANPAPGDSDSAGPSSMGTGSSGNSSASGSARPTDRPPRSRPTRTSADSTRAGLRVPDDDRPSTPARDTTSAATATPRDDQPHKIKSKASRTADTAASAFAGMPPGDRASMAPADPASVTSVTSADPVVPGFEDSPGAEADRPLAAPAAEPVAALQPLRTTRPIGLLGLTAIVCVLGVLTAAIRAIVSQRASRANLA